MKFSYNTNLTLPKQSKRARSVLQDKTDLDLWDCFGRKKTLSYNQRNTVLICSIAPYPGSPNPMYTGGLFHCYMLDNLFIIFGVSGVFSHFYSTFDGKSW